MTKKLCSTWRLPKWDGWPAVPIVVSVLALLAACGHGSPQPELAAPLSMATATIIPTEEVSFTEEQLSALGYEYALSQSDLVTGVTANVQSDQEVWWRVTAELYGVDTLILLNVVMGSTIALEEGQVRFHVFTRQWIGSQIRLERLSPPVRMAIEGLQEGVTGALDSYFRQNGWVPVSVTADDGAIAVTVETG